MKAGLFFNALAKLLAGTAAMALLLDAGLEGYTAYCSKVRWRLVPYVW